MLDMPKIMSGFEGSYTTAANNMGAFEVFFAAAGKVALDGGVETAEGTCKVRVVPGPRGRAQRQIPVGLAEQLPEGLEAVEALGLVEDLA